MRHVCTAVRRLRRWWNRTISEPSQPLVMAIESRVLARQRAPFHVQLELAKLPAQPRLAKEVQIEGRVVRVFRGEAAIQLGAPVLFPLLVCERGEEPFGPPFVYYKDLVAASHIEVYLYGTPPRCTLAGPYEYVLLKEPSLDARMSVEDLLDCDCRKWPWTARCFTTCAGLGLNEVPEDVLRNFGVPPSTVDKIVAFRSGINIRDLHDLYSYRINGVSFSHYEVDEIERRLRSLTPSEAQLFCSTSFPQR
jgi:hypothetical protein